MSPNDLITDTNWAGIREAKAWLIARQWEDTSDDMPEAILQFLDRVQEAAIGEGVLQEEVYGKLK